MERGKSLWDVFQQRNLSRRSFLKTCVALTGLMGLAPTMITQVVEAAETKELPVVVWLHGHECTGCDESFIRSQTPVASDVILNMISLEYMDVLAAAAGEQLEHQLQTTMQKYDGKFILAIEGAVPLEDDGVSCMVGGKPFVQNVKEVAKHAAAVILYGTCAAYGGVQAAKPNPTHSVGAGDVISGKPIIRVPGCPPIPEVMTGVIMHYALFGALPPMDSDGRPKQFFGNRIHDTCYRRPFFDSGMYVEKFDDAGSKAGWCLYKMGCRGPVTYNSCGNMRWWNGMSYPIQSGAPCVGCSSKNFWDTDPFYARVQDIPTVNSVGNADRVGMVAVGAVAAGVAVHGVASIVQQKAKPKSEDKEEN